MDKYIEEKLFCVDFIKNSIHYCKYFIADSFEEALDMCVDKFGSLEKFRITSVTLCEYNVYRKSTKTITVNV